MIIDGLVNKRILKEYIKSRSWRYKDNVLDNINLQIQKLVDDIYIGNYSNEQKLEIKSNDCLENFQNGFQEGYDKGFVNGLHFRKK